MAGEWQQLANVWHRSLISAIYRVAQKWHYFVYALTLSNIKLSTDFQNSFTVRIRRKFVITISLKIPPHLNCVATLPCVLQKHHDAAFFLQGQAAKTCFLKHFTYRYICSTTAGCLDNNWDNKHVVSCCYFLKMCCYRSRPVSIVAFKTLIFHKVV